MKLFTLVLVSVTALLSPACKKKEDKPAPTTTAPTGSAAPTTPTTPTTPEPTAGSGTGSAPAATATTPDDSKDHIVILGRHKNPKPTDPVRVEVHKFKVVKADFDPKKIEGGKATLELDLSSITSESDQRDGHLKSASYFDVAKFATATVDIDNVKLKSGTTYTADAKVTAHGTSKTYPVTFDVIEQKDDSVRIKGSHTFTRLDFGVGTDPAKNSEEQVATEVTIEMVLTLAKT